MSSAPIEESDQLLAGGLIEDHLVAETAGSTAPGRLSIVSTAPVLPWIRATVSPAYSASRYAEGVGVDRAAALAGLAVATTASVLMLPAEAQAAVRHHRDYQVQRAPYQLQPKFTVTYSGSGLWQTTYHAEPPSDPANPGGPHDTNDAHDSNSQRWALRFNHALVVPACLADRCQRLELPANVTGSESVIGKIAHTHIDGLYPADDQSESCTVQSVLSHGASLSAEVSLRSVDSSNKLKITVLIPVAQALGLLPQGCPGQTDSLDGLYDNYFTPGFSFLPDYGPDRWFTSQTIVVPVPVLHRSQRVTFRFHDLARNAPPKNCSVEHPSYERCNTGGTWAGLLELTRAN